MNVYLLGKYSAVISIHARFDNILCHTGENWVLLSTDEIKIKFSTFPFKDKQFKDSNSSLVTQAYFVEASCAKMYDNNMLPTWDVPTSATWS